jgi:hypothetical protein
MIKDYLNAVVNDEKLSASQKQSKVMEIIQKTIVFCECVYFIHSGNDSKKIAPAITSHIECNKLYIAVHAAGQNNVNKAKEILALLDLNLAAKKNYSIILPEEQMVGAEFPYFDLVIGKQLTVI